MQIERSSVVSGDQLPSALKELIRQAAQGQIFHNDDTGMKILALMDPTPAATVAPSSDRKSVGDLFMSLIHTCELNGVNPLDYLTQLLQHPNELAASQIFHACRKLTIEREEQLLRWVFLYGLARRIRRVKTLSIVSRPRTSLERPVTTGS